MSKSEVKVEIFGVGCQKCIKTEEIVKEFLTEEGIPFTIQKIKNSDEITNAGIMATPAVKLNDELLFHGRIPRVKELKKWLEKT